MGFYIASKNCSRNSWYLFLIKYQTHYKLQTTKFSFKHNFKKQEFDTGYFNVFFLVVSGSVTQNLNYIIVLQKLVAALLTARLENLEGFTSKFA